MQVNGKNFTVGADPEALISRGGAPISAFGLIPGTKAQPYKVEKGAIQIDGMATEFNIDPASSPEEFLENMATVMEQLQSFIPDCELLDRASVNFPEEIMKAQPFEALELGCEPDFNAYTMQPNPRPDPSGNMRTAGGHVHIGGLNTNDPMGEMHMLGVARLIKAMDEFVGVYSLLWDKDDERRGLYGAAGAFRPKTYGVEYRTLSNKWIFNRKITRFIYDGVETAIKAAFDQNWQPNDDYAEVINNSDRKHPIFNSLRADYVRGIM